jgi:hypothetical protein
MSDKVSANEGFIANGNARVTIGVAAIGRGATIHASTATVNDAKASLEGRGLSEVAEKLDALMKVLETHAQEITNPQAVSDSTAELAEQLSTEKPRKLDIMATLNSIAGAVGSVTAVAAAVEALKGAIMALL